jgi:hypothetical protein
MALSLHHRDCVARVMLTTFIFVCSTDTGLAQPIEFLYVSSLKLPRIVDGSSAPMSSRCRFLLQATDMVVSLQDNHKAVAQRSVREEYAVDIGRVQKYSTRLCFVGISFPEN